jgi:AbrB family looped-hinge helix DNA binding protein
MVMVFFLAMKHYKISKGGQVSVPAEIRHRWNTSRVVLEDLGDQLVIRPAPADPVSALRGAFATTAKPDTGALRSHARTEESAAETRRQ